jgi:protein TonB
MIARKRGYQGKVILDVLVDENGRAREVIINESSGYVILDRAAATAVADWKFEPAKRGLIAVPMRVKVPVVFRLE